MDSFIILGLAPDASAAEIKQAYRRMAMAWHPDRSKHPEATERFKQIRAAYEALQNREEMREEEKESPVDTPEMARAADIRLDVEVSLEEAAFGCEKQIVFDRGMVCATCGGSGEAGLSRSRPCQCCHGSGRIRHRFHGLEVCAHCGGRGFLNQRICADCSGAGKLFDEVSLQVTVPGGMLPGDELRLAGQGEPGLGELVSGDLFLKLSIRPHMLFELTGCDLAYTMPVNALRLLAGGRIDVAVLGGVGSIEIEAGDIGARTIRLPGRGFPARRAAQPGDLVIHLQPIMPRRLSDEQSRLLRQAAEASEKQLGDSLPEVAAWRQRYGV